MKIPEKIYLYTEGNTLDNDWLYEAPEEFTSFEYTRTDAFIEKATIWLNNNFITHDEYGVISHSFDTEEEMIEDFKDYMKGE